MATFQSPSLMCSSISSSSVSRRKPPIRAAINLPRLPNTTSTLSLPNLTTRGLIQELESRTSTIYTNPITTLKPISPKQVFDPNLISKLYAIMEAVSDRIEMHNNIAEQRNNWNSLLVTSINTISLTAATMAGIAASMNPAGAPLASLKVASTFLYLAATGLLVIMNKIQPSQLAEEQRNAARLFKQLYEEIGTKLAIGGSNLSSSEVKGVMDRVLALDRAYPLPLLGAMLDKFPAAVEPAVWWPQTRRQRERKGRNGWDAELEEEMREIVGVIKRNDKADYLRLGEKALRLNKFLAISGPLLTGVAAFGSAFVGHGGWAVAAGVVGGAMASVVNTIEHGGQVGMVFEMYRSNAGFFRLVEESIESNLEEREVGRRENGELFEMKVALQLGRSLSELKKLAASASVKGEAMEEFGSKLF